MYKYIKYLVAFSLTVALSFNLSFGICNSEFDSYSYTSTNCIEESLYLDLKNNNLSFKTIPNDSKFNFIWIIIKDQKSSNVIDTIYSRSELLSTNKNINLDSLSDGTYYLEIFTAPDHYAQYSSYIYDKNLKIVMLKNKATFSTPLAYTKNKSVYLSKRTDKYALIHYTKPSDDIQSDNPDIIKLSKEITAGLENDYDKAKAIHDWICDNIWYDMDSYKAHSNYGDTSALGTLNSKKSVCQGYSSLTAALLRASGIPAKLVMGHALGIDSAKEWPKETISKDDINHTWVEAYVDSRWISIDATWDSDNTYQNGAWSTNTGLNSYRYFDPTISGFSLDHMLIDYKEEIPNWWIDENNNSLYVNDDGALLKGHHTIDGLKYYFNTSGIMQTGWQTIDGKKYYFTKDGPLAQNTSLVIDGKVYIFDAGGNYKIKKRLTGQPYKSFFYVYKSNFFTRPSSISACTESSLVDAALSSAVAEFV